MFNLTIFAALFGSVLGSPEPSPAVVSVDNTLAPHLPGGEPLSPYTAGARSRALWATDSTSVNAVCVDYSATAHYPAKDSSLVDGLPGDELVSRPATLSVCELEKLHTECVVRINKVRLLTHSVKGAAFHALSPAVCRSLMRSTAPARSSSPTAVTTPTWPQGCSHSRRPPAPTSARASKPLVTSYRTSRAAVGALGPTTRRSTARGRVA